MNYGILCLFMCVQPGLISVFYLFKQGSIVVSTNKWDYVLHRIVQYRDPNSQPLVVIFLGILRLFTYVE